MSSCLQSYSKSCLLTAARARKILSHPNSEVACFSIRRLPSVWCPDMPVTSSSCKHQDLNVLQGMTKSEKALFQINPVLSVKSDV